MAHRSNVIARLAIVAVAGAFVLPSIAATLSGPTSDGGVVPYITDEPGPGGNVSCDALGFAHSSDRVDWSDDDGGSFDASFPDGIEVNTDGTLVRWASTFPIGAVIVKGGPAANIYEYEPQANGDSGLAAPQVASGNPAGLSNLTFCWNPEEELSEWCSPGYWRQRHHLNSWRPTGYTPSDSYNTIFSTALAGDPTLWDVLQSPKLYARGGHFEAVGDLLSDAHPDVNFTGTRTPDSCPL